MNIVWTGQNKGMSRIDLPCGKCIGCKLERSYNTSVKAMLESKMHEDNSFVTLTFNEEMIPANRSLDVSYVQAFMKRLRKVRGPGIKFLAAGEYGGQLGRPHYHILLFGADFPDKVLFQDRNGEKLYISQELESLWSDRNRKSYGFSTVGTVTFKSAAYVARYNLKKVSTKDDPEHYVDKHTGEILRPEFVVASNGGRAKSGGVGASWFRKYGLVDVYPSDEVVVNGYARRPPRYFDKLLERHDSQLLDEIKARRMALPRDYDEYNDVRLKAMAEVKEAQIKTLKRALT